MREDSRARASYLPMSLKSKRKKATCPVVVLQTLLISWIIAELVHGEQSTSYLGQKELIDDVRKYTFSRSRC
jgi:hypothetical protein